MTWATPGIVSRRGRKIQSANDRSSNGGVFPLVLTTPTSMTSPMIDVTGPITGLTVLGNTVDNVVKRSDTSWRARKMSESQPNSTETTDRPTPDVERTRCTSGAPFMARSIGPVTRVSTSSGESPPASAMIVTVGRFRSGNTSTGRFASVMPP